MPEQVLMLSSISSATIERRKRPYKATYVFYNQDLVFKLDYGANVIYTNYILMQRKLNDEQMKHIFYPSHC
jgi:hypothetical protein